MNSIEEKWHKNWHNAKISYKKDEMKGILKAGDSVIPIKCYTGNFSRRKIGVLFANKSLAGFLIKYLPADFLQDCGVDKNGFIYFNFVNPSRIGQEKNI